ncbi:MAG: hypothetical protein JWM74_1970 [Myxococcaceae bacterium]|nr:hypothetical protein [Myxococcaceae bacterium]
MSFAYDPSGGPIVCADGAEVLTYSPIDEHPLWRRVLEALIVSVGTTSRQVFTLEASGQLAVWDGPSGAFIGGARVAPARALAVSAQGTCAIATADAIAIVDAQGTRSLPIARAAALTFAADGRMLGVAGDDGRVLVVEITTGATALSATLPGAVTSVAPHPDGAWFATSGDAIFRVERSGEVARVTGLGGQIAQRVVCSQDGRLLGLQLSGKTAVVLAYPSRDTVASFSYMDRAVLGIAFGPPRVIFGVGLDKGDGNKIDLHAETVSRTDTHPGRTHNRWALKAGFETGVLARALA